MQGRIAEHQDTHAPRDLLPVVQSGLVLPQQFACRALHNHDLAEIRQRQQKAKRGVLSKQKVEKKQKIEPSLTRADQGSN